MLPATFQGRGAPPADAAAAQAALEGAAAQEAAAKAALEDPAQEAAAAGARKGRQPAELMKLLLQAMVSGLVRTSDDIRSFLGSTLYCAQLKRDPHFQGPPLLASEARHAIARLKGQRLAQWDGSEWRGSGLGKAISVSERAVASGARTLHELEEVRQKGICLVNDVHVIYLCVPLDKMHRYLGEWPVDWPWLQGMLASKSTESQQIKALCEGLLGLEMGLLDPLAAGMKGSKTLDEARQRFGRLWLATMLFLALNNRHEQMNPFWKHSKHGATFAENRARMIVCRKGGSNPRPADGRAALPHAPSDPNCRGRSSASTARSAPRS